MWEKGQSAIYQRAGSIFLKVGCAALCRHNKTALRAKPGKRDEVITLTKVMLEKTQSEQGVPVYLFNTAVDQPDEFWFYDLYESPEARTVMSINAWRDS